MYAVNLDVTTSVDRFSEWMKVFVGKLCPGTLVIHMATGKHLWEAFALLVVGHAAAGSTGISSMMSLPIPVPQFLTREQALGFLCLVVSALAMWGFNSIKINHRVVVLCLIPQQILLFVTSIGALSACIHGQYPDGYIPDGGGWFISTDQVLRILLAPFYTVAIFARAMRHEYRIHRGK